MSERARARERASERARESARVPGERGGGGEERRRNEASKKTQQRSHSSAGAAFSNEKVEQVSTSGAHSLPRLFLQLKKTKSLSFASGKLYLSQDSGATWAPQANFQPSAPSTLNWNAVAMSASGSVLAAGTDDATTGKLFLSRDLGATWVEQTSNLPAAARFTSITVSDDGNKIATTTFSSPGRMYYTTDGGATWNAPAGAPSTSKWQGIASSADGAKLLAGDEDSVGGNLWLSGDSGVAFVAQAAGMAVPTHGAP